jgi:iron complex transport system ATP-binding protein
MGKPVLVISGASVGYGKGGNAVTVVTSIDAKLESGELVALIGCNGAGKSTLLRTIAAYQPPLSGKVEYCGCDSADMSSQSMSRLISVVLTTPVSPLLTVRELVSLGRTPYTNFLGHLSVADKEAVDSAMEEMGVLELADRQVATLSDGERQKCMVAKAIAQQTPLLLLDEPTAFLDYPSKVHLLRMLKKFSSEKGMAVLVSTHDLELALRLSDRIWLIDNGNMHCGTVEELSQNGLLQSFIGGETIRYNSKENRIEII